MSFTTKVETMTITKILTMTEIELRWYIIAKLKAAKVPHTVTDDYIVTNNTGVLPLVCVHTDIVGGVPPTAKQIVKTGSTLSVKGEAKVLGADDRAGVYIALNLLHRKDFNFAFFAKEEVGCKGSTQFALLEDLYDYSCFIGLDRASRNGKQNAATYGFDNDELLDLFVYPESMGSLCDASLLSSYSDIACINLSVGYDHEHSSKEILDVSLMLETLQVMKELVVPDKIYNYEEQPYSSRWASSSYDYKSPFSKKSYEAVVCDNCGISDVLYIVGDMYACEVCVPDVEESYFID
jgi:hypothetical protein